MQIVKFKYFQAVVLLVTLGFLGLGTWGTLSIRQEFDPVLLLPADSYVRQWLNKNDFYFPSTGWAAEVIKITLNTPLWLN